MTRIATLAQQQLTLFHTLNTQSRAADLQVQLASNTKSQEYSGIQRDSLRLINLENARAQTSQFTSNIQVADQRLELTDLALASIEEISRDFRNMLDTTLDGPDAFAGDLVALAQNMRLMVVDLLNSRDGDRYLFGGGRIDSQPVDLSSPGYSSAALIQSDGVTVERGFYESYWTDVLGNTLPFTAGGGTFYEQIFFDKNGFLPTAPLPADMNNPTLIEFVAEDASLWQYYVGTLNSSAMLANPKTDYYQGDQLASVVRADEDLDLTTDVRADLPVFQQILSALDAVASLPAGDANDPFERAVVETAWNMMRAALDPLNTNSAGTVDSLRLDVALSRNTLAVTLDRHESFLAYAEGVVNELEVIDQTEVVVRLQSEQRALEASFSALAQVQQLSLLDFI